MVLMFLLGRRTELQIDQMIQIRPYYLLGLDPNGLQRLPADDKGKRHFVGQAVMQGEPDRQ